MLLFSSVTSAQNMGDGSQLKMLENLSPDQREEVLRGLADSADAGSKDEELLFPDVVQPMGTKIDEDEEEPPQIFDEMGEPLLDSERRPVYLTDELLQSLETEGPEDWKVDPTPFFEQSIVLRPFGYGLFAGVPTTFAPATDVPVPPEYRLGPGDTVDVQLFGKENRQYSLVVNRDGTINFPSIGPVNVMGKPFEELKQAILDRVAEQLIGTRASVNMGALRSIQVLVTGDARRPGSYTVSGLSTVTNALFVSGGVEDIGSLRNIQVRRNSKIVATLDLYDLLLNGNAEDDVRLNSGDVIFIPTVGATVGVGGFVNRPAIYELKNEKTVQQIVKLAGGLRADALPQLSRLERYAEGGQREYIDIDLTSAEGQSQQVLFGDTLLVPPAVSSQVGGVLLMGHVLSPGRYQWKQGMRLTDLIEGLDSLQVQADLGYVLVRRETYPDKRIKVLSADLGAALANPDSVENIKLSIRDQVSVFQLRSNAQEYNEQIDPEDMARKMLEQEILDLGTTPAVSSTGFPAPGSSNNSDLLLAIGENEEPVEEEIVRDELRTLEQIHVEGRDLAEKMSDRRERVNWLLVELSRQSSPRYPFERVTVAGDVREPGDYPFEAGMRVADLVRASAGLMESAYKVEAELASYAIVGGIERDFTLKTLNLELALQGDPAHNLLVRPQDFLSVRRVANWENESFVTIRGEVRHPGRYAFKSGETLIDVIARAGGLTEDAFPAGSIYLREELRQREQQQLDSLTERLRGDLALLTLRSAGSTEASASAAETQSAAQAILSDLQGTEAVGRLVIDLPKMIANPENLSLQVRLESRDELLIPDRTQDVTIIGEVFFPTSHLFAEGVKRDDYINSSGGVAPSGSKKQIYVVKANGAVIAGGGRFSKQQTIDAGDTIVVPLDTEKGFRLRSVASVTTILYNIAIAVAAINGLTN